MTQYKPHQEEECEEKFKKTCYIEYEQRAYSENVEVDFFNPFFLLDCKLFQVCTTPWVRGVCDKGEEVEQDCTTVYQSECSTTQTIHDVEDDLAVCKTVIEEKCENVQEGVLTVQKCDKWPREICSIEKTKVQKFTPNTSCEKVPREMCAPKGCPIREVRKRRMVALQYTHS